MALAAKAKIPLPELVYINLDICSEQIMKQVTKQFSVHTNGVKSLIMTEQQTIYNIHSPFGSRKF